MARVTILGAGAMGSALATPLRANGHEVALWGTWLDDHFLQEFADGGPHPGTKVPLARGAEVFTSDRIADALAGADAVIVAVASVGVLEVSRRAAPHLTRSADPAHRPVLGLVSKGFHQRMDGSIDLMPEAVREAIEDPGAVIVAIGGPCKANEVAAGRFTATAFASTDDGRAATALADLMRTPDYRPSVSDDEAGLEVCAPLKNVYAIALGYADGLEQSTGEPWHNLKSAIFARASEEMGLVAEALGGRVETAFGLPGVGDLEVTGLSGRNKVYGARIGAGETAAEALEHMREAGQTVEGVAASGLAAQLVDSRLGSIADRLTLLAAIRAVLDGAQDPLAVIRGAL
ncbi:glycerol-3-phosphate dehydrogenase [Ruania alkalisoli]|uniref:Glycerol-3-phosphate dehydrogenase n=1 Tax=Ruania alkalisoli TaxID=2779775 RepID=A0A7M1SVR5_9MICO|nr:2-dehydropantoate 2-reductase N-terminal domain-containing protein [Ruania alkalisoli]QOR70842.1 glycerol-3-phosphate dehydrogenase [Ruania alkalisoli]